MIRTAFLALLASIAVLAQDHAPVIGPLGVMHGASYQPLGFRFNGDFATPGGVAPGSIFILQGGYLGPDELVLGSAPFSLRLPDLPGGTEVHVRSLETGEVVQARIVHAWAFQVAALLPEGFPLGEAEAQVWHEGRASEPASFPVLRSYPGLFLSNQDGSGRAIVQNFEAPADLPLNGLTRSARPGQHVILWGTGLGDAQDVQAQILGRSIPFDYAGPAPGLPGVDQFNLRLPDDLEAFGCYVRVYMSVGEVQSAPATLSIAPEGGACEHPWGLSPERLAEIENGARATYLRLAVGDGTTPPDATPQVFRPQAFGEALTLNESGVETYASRFGFGRNQLIPASRFSCGPGFGVRVVFGDFLPGGVEPIPPRPEPADPSARGADIGFPWLLTGPNGATLELPAQTVQSFIHKGAAGPVTSEPGFLAPGPWRLQVPGGAESAFAMPGVPAITSPDLIRRGESFELTWPVDVAGPPVAANAQVTFRIPDPEHPGQVQTLGFGCPVDYRSGRVEFLVSALEDPLLGVTEAELTFRVMSQEPIAPVPGLDRIEIEASAFRTWKAPLE